MFRIGLVKSSFIPAKDIRILRELTRYRYNINVIVEQESYKCVWAFDAYWKEAAKSNYRLKAVVLNQ